jgi:hypothetical protein
MTGRHAGDGWMGAGMGNRRSLVVGFSGYAMLMMVMIGIFSFFAGLVGILEDEIYTAPRDYFLDLGVVGWGIVHMAVGVLLVVAAFLMIFGIVWARAVGVIVAAISAITNFMAIPYYPFWSLLVLALDIGVIWALTIHGRAIIGDEN